MVTIIKKVFFFFFYHHIKCFWALFGKHLIFFRTNFFWKNEEVINWLLRYLGLGDLKAEFKQENERKKILRVWGSFCRRMTSRLTSPMSWWNLPLCLCTSSSSQTTCLWHQATLTGVWCKWRPQNKLEHLLGSETLSHVTAAWWFETETVLLLVSQVVRDPTLNRHAVFRNWDNHGKSFSHQLNA